jgi:hypothetical protein
VDLLPEPEHERTLGPGRILVRVVPPSFEDRFVVDRAGDRPGLPLADQVERPRPAEPPAPEAFDGPDRNVTSRLASAIRTRWQTSVSN